jgi:8-oxo-dGTP pyrophosphatase MutT (NUDIX family)
MYKIFINDKPLILTKSEEIPARFQELEKINNPETFSIMDWVRKIEGLSHKGCWVVDAHPKLLFEEFRTHFIAIEAGGGLVFNDKDQILLIKRLGKWDLPKGKIDPGESQEQGAKREVEEECGINKLSIQKDLGKSFHTYKIQGHRFLKITYWFLMKTEYNGILIPQEEENITDARWFDWQNLNPEELDTYQSIREVLLDLKAVKN